MCICCFLILSVFLTVQASGRSSRRASESSTHSGGRERSNSAVKQASPPPPSIPEQPRKEEGKKAKKESPKKVLISHLSSEIVSRCSQSVRSCFTQSFCPFSLYTPSFRHRVVAGESGSLGRGRMKLTCQMIKTHL